MSVNRGKPLAADKLAIIERMAKLKCIATQIAAVAGCDPQTVREWCKRNGWYLHKAQPPRKPGNHAVSHPQNTSGQVTLVRSCAYAERPVTATWPDDFPGAAKSVGRAA